MCARINSVEFVLERSHGCDGTLRQHADAVHVWGASLFQAMPMNCGGLKRMQHVCQCDEHSVALAHLNGRTRQHSIYDLDRPLHSMRRNAVRPEAVRFIVCTIEAAFAQHRVPFSRELVCANHVHQWIPAISDTWMVLIVYAQIKRVVFNYHTKLSACFVYTYLPWLCFEQIKVRLMINKAQLTTTWAFFS